MHLAHAYPVAKSKKRAAVGKTDAEGRTFWKRLEIASEWAGKPCTPSDIAEELNIWNSAVTKYVEGGFPAKAKINRLAENRGVRSEWLLSGQGDMVEEKLLDVETQELLRLWRALEKDAKGRLMASARYEFNVSHDMTTGRRLALTDEIIRQMQSNPDNKPQ